MATLQDLAHAFEVQLSDIGLHRLAKAEAFRFFRQLVNYNPATAAAAHPHLRHASRLLRRRFGHRLPPRPPGGRRSARQGAVDEGAAEPHLCPCAGGPLPRFPASSSPVSNGSGCPNDRMRRDLQARRRHFFNKRVSIVNYVAPDSAARRDARRRLRERHRASTRRGLDGPRSPRPLLWGLLADARAAWLRTPVRCSTARPKR